MFTRKAIIDQTIHFASPTRIPLWVEGDRITHSDVFTYDLSLTDEGNPQISEWGFLRNVNEKEKWFVPEEATLADWKDVDIYQAPPLNMTRRLAGVSKAAAYCEDRYRLASLGMSGYSIYRALRGRENSAVDFLIEPDRFLELMELIFDFETSMFDTVARKGFHAIEFCDDWGPRLTSKITLSLWRKLLKNYYARQIAYAKELGLNIWFNTTAEGTDFFGDLKEIGVDVVCIEKPQEMKIATIGRFHRGKLCFAVRMDELVNERDATIIANVYDCLALSSGGFIGMLSRNASESEIQKSKKCLQSLMQD